jgi:lactoylglutathione lyase
MMNISRINHIGLRVSDYEAARDFYQQLGFAPIGGPGGPEPVAIVEHPSGININFIINANHKIKGNVLMDVPTKHTGYTHVALEVDDAERAIAQLKSLDIPLSGEAMTHHNGSISFFIRDPDMNVVEFIEYRGSSVADTQVESKPEVKKQAINQTFFSNLKQLFARVTP